MFAGQHTGSMTEAPHSYPPPPRNPGGNTGQQQLTRFFDWIRSSGMVRGDERWFAGVCGAIAARTKLDPLVVRGIAVVLAILGAPVLFAYAVGWALLPNTRGEIHAEQAFRGIFEPAMVAIAALLVLTIVPFSRGVWWEGAPLAWGMPEWLATTLAVGWGIAVTVGLVWLVFFLITRRSNTGPTGANPPSWDPAGAAGQAATAGASGQAGTAGTARPTGPATAASATTTTFGPASTTGYPQGFPPPPPAPPAPDAEAPRSDWDAFDAQNRAWQDQHRQWKEDRVAWRASSQEWRRHRHPGAGFTAILLGIALTTGAVAAGTIAVAGATEIALLIGLAFGLGVLALGIIISGIRGRDSGALGGFAFLTAVALVAVGVFPQGTQFSPFGSPAWAVSSSQGESTPGYALIGGRATIDLTELDRASSADTRVVDVWVGFGETELILPENQTVSIESNSLIGSVDYGDDSRRRGGMFFHDSRVVNGSSDRTVPEIRVWTLVGHVSILDNSTAR